MSLGVPPTPVLPLPLLLKKIIYKNRLATIAQRFCLFNVLLPPRTEIVTLPSSFFLLSQAVCLLLLSKPLGIPVLVMTRCEVCALPVMLTGTNVSGFTPAAQAKLPCAWLPVLGECVP